MAVPRHDLDKPHPPTPVHASSLKPLTIESVNHLHKFIGHVLEEETSFRDADKDAWVSGIESALNDFAKEVDAGAWLSGIRRARALEQKRKEQAAAEAKKREQERIAKEKETEARNKAKPRTPTLPADSVKYPALAKEADPTVSEAKTEISHTRKPPSEEANRNLRALQQLRNLARTRRRSSSDDQKRARHLLLTVVLPDAPSSLPPASCVATGDTTAPTCTFTPYVYSLPAPDLFGEDPDDNSETVVNSTLYGFREWDGALQLFTLQCHQLTLHKVNVFEAYKDIELIGGTFSLNKVLSANEHASIVRVLRLSTYTLLSLLLEQKFLSSSSIKLHYPKSAPPPISIPSPTATLTHRNSAPDVQVEAKPRKRDILRQGIWSLLHKRLPRSATLDTSDSRGVSIDLPRSEPDVPKTSRTSLDGSPTSSLRQRRFSIFGGDRAPPPSPAALAPTEPSPDRAFQCALHHIEESKGMLSASPGLVFPPPQLLVRLAGSEKEHPSRHLSGEERTGLTSILGWEGKKAAGRGNLISTAAFLLQQQLSLLYSEHVYGPNPTSQVSADGTLNKPAGGEPKQRTYVHCGAPVQCLTYVYYASGNHDQSLGDMITSMCVQADEPCPRPGCKARRRQHERRWIHGGIRVVVQTEARDPSTSPDVHSEDIEMWQSCKICRNSTAQCKMSDGT
jgi:1-phosphatidylinositol-3-phosphate 5-kinase